MGAVHGGDMVIRVALAGTLLVAVLWGGFIYAAIEIFSAEQEPDW